MGVRQTALRIFAAPSKEKREIIMCKLDHKSKSCLAAALGLVLSAALAVPSSPAAAEELTIVGTGDGMAMLKQVGDAFSQANPGVTVAVPESIGSGGAIKAVGGGEQKIGRVARKLGEKDKGYNLSYVPMANIPVVFFAHKGIKVDGLTRQQAADIYAGKVGNWNEVGGPDAKIRVVRREDGDSSLSALQGQLPEFKAIELTPRSKTASSNGENIEVVAATEGAIGFGPYSKARAEQFTVLKLDGKSALDAGYPVYVTLAIIYKEETKTPTVQKFVEFVKTPAAQAAIKAADAIPY
jgi:phosphate transport system substrate-binding protein